MGAREGIDAAVHGGVNSGLPAGWRSPMPILPWAAAGFVGSVDPAATALVMASRFRLSRFRDVLRFVADSMRIHRQVRAADGALGISLIARPLRREFMTLSASRDRSRLEAVVRAHPHAGAMRRHRRAMAESTFTFSPVPRNGLPVPWDDARRRLDDACASAGGPA
jgi:hypothetical protein